MKIHCEIVFPLLFPVRRLETREESGTRQSEKQFSVTNWTGDVRNVFFHRPNNFAPRDIAGAIRRNSKKFFRWTDGKNEPSGENGRRCDFIVQTLNSP